MEFDTNMRLKPRAEASIHCGDDLEKFDGELWKMLSEKVGEVGQGSGGELWADYSTKLQTRHLVARVEQSEADGDGFRHSVKVLSGARPSRLADVVIMFAAVAAIWGISKYLQPGSSAIWSVVFIVAAVLLGFTLAVSTGKGFGAAESAKFINELENKYKI